MPPSPNTWGPIRSGVVCRCFGSKQKPPFSCRVCRSRGVLAMSRHPRPDFAWPDDGSECSSMCAWCELVIRKAPEVYCTDCYYYQPFCSPLCWSFHWNRYHRPRGPGGEQGAVQGEGEVVLAHNIKDDNAIRHECHQHAPSQNLPEASKA